MEGSVFLVCKVSVSVREFLITIFVRDILFKSFS